MRCPQRSIDSDAATGECRVLLAQNDVHFAHPQQKTQCLSCIEQHRTCASEESGVGLDVIWACILSNPGASAPGLRAHLANREYFRYMPQTPVAQTLSWLEWLRERIGVANHLHFSAKDGQLNESPRYVQRHRPEKFLGSLLICHSSCRELSPELSACLSKTEVLCRDDRKVLFKDTYFPTKRLTQLVDSLVEPGAFFPWLWLDAQDAHETPPPDWQRLLGDLGADLPPPAGLTLRWSCGRAHSIARPLQSRYKASQGCSDCAATFRRSMRPARTASQQGKRFGMCMFI